MRIYAASAGEFNQVLDIGDVAPAWSNLPGVDGRAHSLAELPADALVVVVFTCNSCPIARDYEDRIIELVRRSDELLRVVAINVNTIPEDQFDKMQERAAARHFNFPYLYDESQSVAKEYGALWTPEFFILNKDRKIVYMGGMDDSSNVEIVKHHYLEPALKSLLAGEKPEVAETPAIGCKIRYERPRRRRSE